MENNGISRRAFVAAAAFAPVLLKAESADPAAMADRPDHFQLGIADLDQGVALVRDATGVEPAFGGAHPGYGTRNALISLGEGSYLEILALDPAQADLKTPRTDRIRALGGPTILTYAMQTTIIERKLALAQEIPGVTGKLDPRSRKKPDGTTLEWTNLPLESPFGPQLPFFIDWKGATHPSKTAPAGCKLLSFEVLHPEAEALRAAYRKLGIGIAVKAAAQPGFVATLGTPKGQVVFVG